MRSLALGVLVFVLFACDPGAQPSPSPTSSPRPNPADTRAADLRTHLDLLLGEQVMIVAKQAVAAINQTDDYQSYAALLATNTADLTEIWRRAFGTTTAATLAASWDTQNAYLVDYTIGVATHKDDRSKAAMANLTQKFVPQFSGLITDASRLPLDPVALLLSQQELENKAFIDDYAAQKWQAFYSDLHRAYVQTARFGDALSVEIAHRYPDKFPGDPELRAVNVRVSANTLLQERSYLETMWSAARIGGRISGNDVGLDALEQNSEAIAGLFAPTVGRQPVDIEAELNHELELLMTYTGRVETKNLLVENASDFAASAEVPKAASVDHLNAVIKVVDDLLAKNWANIANDDRAAATSTQPMADAIRG